MNTRLLRSKLYKQPMQGSLDRQFRPHTHTSVSQVPRTDSDLPLNADSSSVPDSGSVSPEQTWLETDQLGVEETRDLLVSVMFVLKHLDNGK